MSPVSWGEACLVQAARGIDRRLKTATPGMAVSADRSDSPTRSRLNASPNTFPCAGHGKSQWSRLSRGLTQLAQAVFQAVTFTLRTSWTRKEPSCAQVRGSMPMVAEAAVCATMACHSIVCQLQVSGSGTG